MCTCREPQRRTAARRQSGDTMVELIVALMLAGVILTSMWHAWSMLGRRSADPLGARQALAVAQSLLREIELQPLPGSAVAGATPGRTGFASITDYHGLTMNGIVDVEGAAVPGLEGYSAAVSVQPMALAGVPVGDGWWIAVDVSGPDGQPVRVALWRARR